MNDTTKHILTAVAASAAGAVAAALITHYLTKQATVASVATGKTPLPAGATPIVATPTPTPMPAPPPQLPPSLDVQSAAAIAQMMPLLPLLPQNGCPPGYEKLDSGDCVKSQGGGWVPKQAM